MVFDYSRTSFPDVIYKKDAPQNIAEFHKKTPVMDSLFNKVAGLQTVTLSKRDSNTGFSL